MTLLRRTINVYKTPTFIPFPHHQYLLHLQSVLQLIHQPHLTHYEVFPHLRCYLSIRLFCENSLLGAS